MKHMPHMSSFTSFQTCKALSQAEVTLRCAGSSTNSVQDPLESWGVVFDCKIFGCMQRSLQWPEISW